MMKDFKQLLMKKAKEGKFLSEDDKAAKMDILKELKDIASGAMGDNLKKVTVASDSAEGLKAGLKKAEEVVEKKLEEDEDEESEMEEMPEDSEMSKEEKIKKLEEELASLKGE